MPARLRPGSSRRQVVGCQGQSGDDRVEDEFMCGGSCCGSEQRRTLAATTVTRSAGRWFRPRRRLANRRCPEDGQQGRRPAGHASARLAWSGCGVHTVRPARLLSSRSAHRPKCVSREYESFRACRPCVRVWLSAGGAADTRSVQPRAGVWVSCRCLPLGVDDLPTGKAVVQQGGGRPRERRDRTAHS